jgi:hypothetical protein
MAWWSAGSGDMIGDEPVDILQSTLQSLAQRRESEMRPKLGLKDLLDSIAALIYADKGETLQQPDSFKHVSAELAITGTRVSSDEAHKALDHTDGSLAEAMGRIAEIYERDQMRKPRVSELTELFAFVLGYKPEKYLSLGQEVESVTAVG